MPQRLQKPSNKKGLAVKNNLIFFTAFFIIMIEYVLIFGLSAIIFFLIYKNKKEERELKEKNADKEKLEELTQTLTQYRNALENKASTLQIHISSLEEKILSIEDETKLKLEELSIVEGDVSYEKSRLQEFTALINIKEKEYNEINKIVSQLHATQEAYIEQKRREEEMNEQKDYYRLILSEENLYDIDTLRNTQLKVNKKDSVDKIIWDGYYKPAFDVLSSHMFNGTEKISGIYCITNINNEKKYIGQAVDIRERWREHIKSAIAHTSQSNKLYQEMKKYKPENFTFEIIEKCERNELNERETFWIDFYKTKEFGLNGTKGNIATN